MPVGTSPAGPTLGESGEFALIARITADLPTSPEILLGPGDDAALIGPAGPVLTSVDVLVEGGIGVRVAEELAETTGRSVARAARVLAAWERAGCRPGPGEHDERRAAGQPDRGRPARRR